MLKLFIFNKLIVQNKFRGVDVRFIDEVANNVREFFQRDALLRPASRFNSFQFKFQWQVKVQSITVPLITASTAENVLTKLVLCISYTSLHFGPFSSMLLQLTQFTAMKGQVHLFFLSFCRSIDVPTILNILTVRQILIILLIEKISHCKRQSSTNIQVSKNSSNLKFDKNNYANIFQFYYKIAESEVNGMSVIQLFQKKKKKMFLEVMVGLQKNLFLSGSKENHTPCPDVTEILKRVPFERLSLRCTFY